jgi:hypothetical protein
MRFAVALAVLAVAWAGAVYIHERHPLHSFIACIPNTKGGYGSAYNCTPTPESEYIHPSWEDPVAVLLGIGGLAVTAGIITVRRKRQS